MIKLVSQRVSTTFFTTIASDLAQELPASSGEYGDAFVKMLYEAKGVGEELFTFNILSVTKVTDLLRGLDSNKAIGLDAIPAKFLSDTADVIGPYVIHIMNLSISQSKVPQQFKKARVTALYK